MLNKKKVLLAFSGGIDSTYSIWVLLKRGFQVELLYLENTPIKQSFKLRLEKIAKYFSLKIHFLNIQKEFEKEVIKNFINDYKKGITPSPCINCNKTIKFKYLKEYADKLGIYYIATGHYIRKRKYRSTYYLYKSLDIKKDQSYFLYKVESNVLKRLIFPLANYKKDFVKKDLFNIIDNNLIEQKESQELCFVANDDLLDFFNKKIKNIKKGKIINIANNKVLGEHKGIMFYTIGQRKALGLAGGPWFVVRLDAKKNIIYVVHNNEKNKYLLEKYIYLDKIHWQGKAEKLPSIVLAKIRSNQKLQKVKIIREKKKYKIEFLDKVQAISPGQSIVFYKKNRLLGGEEIPINYNLSK